MSQRARDWLIGGLFVVTVEAIAIYRVTVLVMLLGGLYVLAGLFAQVDQARRRRRAGWRR